MTNYDCSHDRHNKWFSMTNIFIMRHSKSHFFMLYIVITVIINFYFKKKVCFIIYFDEYVTVFFRLQITDIF